MSAFHPAIASVNLATIGHWITVALFTSLLAACAATDLLDFDEPEVELIGLKPLSNSGMEARFLVQLRITNPNSIPLDIDGMSYEVLLRDQKVLSGVSNEGISIGAYSESTADLEVAVSLLGSLGLIKELMTRPPEGGLPYRLNAKLSRSGIGGAIRVSREGTLDLNGPK